MTTGDVGRLFALTFALRQLGENLRDLAERCHDLRPQGFAVRARSAPS
jgi:hypothetical protein